MSTLRVTAEKADHTPISDVRVTVFKSDGCTPIRSGLTTVTAGMVSFTLSAADDYVVTAWKERVHFLDAMKRVETGIVNLVMTGDQPTIADADPPSMCAVYGYILGAGGEPFQGVRVVAEVSPRALNSGTVDSGGTGVDARQVYIAPGTRETKTDAHGHWRLYLPVGATVAVSMPYLSLSKTFRVPDADMVSFKDVRAVLGPANVGVTSDTPATNSYSQNYK